MIFDTNKCIACQTCTVACKTTWTPGRGQEYMYWNNVETKPYGFYPLGWDVTILEKLGVQPMDGPVYGGKTLFDAAPTGEAVLGYLPEDLDYAHPNIGEDDSTGLMPRGAHLDLPHMQWMFYLPRICNHCTYPACLSACPRQVIYKRKDDGIVLLDQSRCRGYRECVRGCPYKKVYFNTQTPTTRSTTWSSSRSWPCRSTRSSGWSRTPTTSRRSTCPRRTSARCSAGASSRRSRRTGRPART
jgi:nitrate reductase beta subunit